MKRKDLSAKQYKALAVMGAGGSQDAAALAAKVPQAKMVLWMRDARFRDELRLLTERVRQTFESRVFALANNSAGIVGEMIADNTDKNRQLEGVKLAFNSAVRLANRYKELQVEGVIAPAQPLVVFPVGTKFPWQNKIALPPVPLEIPETIDVDAEVVDSDDDK